MRRLGLLLALFFPLLASAAYFVSGTTLSVPEPISGNGYLFGREVNVLRAVSGDLAVLAGTLTLASDVAGDVLVLGGTVEDEGSVGGDVRAAAGQITLKKNVGGDLLLLGGVVRVEGKIAGAAYVGGADVRFSGGAQGLVRIWGGRVVLSGTYEGDVQASVSESLSILPGTVIKGTLRYDAPLAAEIADDASIGAVEYAHGTPLASPSDLAAFFSAAVGVFFVARLLAALIVTGLFARLFPAFANQFADRGLRRFLLLSLLGLGLFIGVPLLLIMLATTVVGAGLALVGLAAYLLLVGLAFVYAPILVGALLARVTAKRRTVVFRDALIGVLLLFLLASLPFVGWFIFFLCIVGAMGTLAALLYETLFESPPNAL